MRFALVLASCTFVSVARAEVRAEHHRRLVTKHGPVHLWTPSGYEAKRAALVIYVHGYYDDVDYAWTSHRLASQFRASGLDALFVACEAPTSDREPVAWTSLGELLATVSRVEPLPGGRVVALAHSGGHRTIASWLDDDRLDTIGLLDAGYGDLSAYAAWLSKHDDRRLFDVGDLTVERTDQFHQSLPPTLSLDRFPKEGLSRDARKAQVIYIRSQMGHMELVTRGIAIPTLLRAVSAPSVSDSDLAIE